MRIKSYFPTENGINNKSLIWYYKSWEKISHMSSWYTDHVFHKKSIIGSWSNYIYDYCFPYMEFVVNIFFPSALWLCYRTASDLLCSNEKSAANPSKVSLCVVFLLLYLRFFFLSLFQHSDYDTSRYEFILL